MSESLEKNKLAIIPLIVGLTLLFYSWYSSYPISINYPGDILRNNISPLYWISLPLVLGSLFIIGVFSKNRFWKILSSVTFVLTIYSLSYFYFSMSTPDSTYFRGVTEYFIKTKNLDPSQFYHLYLQWPAFFLLADITTMVSGLSLVNFEFLFYTIIASLLAITMYVYASKLCKNAAFLAVAAYFIAMFNFFNLQAVPYSLAAAFLFILFMLETKKRSIGVTVTTQLLVFCISISHFFAALFFVLYLLFRSLINKSKRYFELFLATACIYLLVQFTLASTWLGINLSNLFRLPPETSTIIATTLNRQTTTLFDSIATTMSGVVTIGVILVCFVGFIFLLVRRKLRAIDGAIFLAGLTYSVLGLAYYIIGSRTISIFFIPVSLGIAYLSQTKFRSYIIGLFLILLILFVFVPIRYSTTQTYPRMFHTEEDLVTADFMIEKYNWDLNTKAIADSGTKWYISTQIQGNTAIYTSLAPYFELSYITAYDCIIYSVGLAYSLHESNISEIITSQQIIDRFDIIYNSGFSYIAQKPG